MRSKATGARAIWNWWPDMASHVVGPLLLADQPLTDDEIGKLHTNPLWSFDLLDADRPPPVGVAWQREQPTVTMAATALAATWSKR